MKKTAIFISLFVLIFIVACTGVDTIAPTTTSDFSDTTIDNTTTSMFSSIPETLTTVTDLTILTTTQVTTAGNTTVSTIENTSGSIASEILINIDYDIDITDIFDSTITIETSTDVENNESILYYNDFNQTKKSLLDPETVEVVEFYASVFEELDESVTHFSSSFDSLQNLVSGMTSYLEMMAVYISYNSSEENVWYTFAFGEFLYYYDQEQDEVILYTNHTDGSKYVSRVKNNYEGKDSFVISAYLPNNMLFDEFHPMYQSFEYIEGEKYEYIQYLPDFIDQSSLYSALYTKDHWEMFTFNYTNMQHYIIDNQMIYVLIPFWANNVNVQAYAYSDTSFLAGVVSTITGEQSTEISLEMKEFDGWRKIVFIKDLLWKDPNVTEENDDPLVNWTTFGNGLNRNDVDFYTVNSVISTGDYYEDKIIFAGANAFQTYTLIDEDLVLTQAKAIAYFIIASDELTGGASPEDLTNYLSDLGISMKDFELSILISSLLNNTYLIDDLINDLALTLYEYEINNYEEMQLVFMYKMENTESVFDIEN